MTTTNNGNEGGKELKGKQNQETVESIVDKAMKEHHRKKSQFQAIQNDLGLIFDKDDVNAITKKVMKRVFAQKHSETQQQQMHQLQHNHEEHIHKMQERVNDLQKQLSAKNEELTEKQKEIEIMQQEIKHLTQSKRQLVINSNLCLNEMRAYLVQYQRCMSKVHK
mmetsp:Transcript_59581/g.94797  ORF Transcript_59581/g.94797 Transcript_59581/m.94797 type:complete len:165 (+) Transcript_59581:66-560(+)